MRGRIIVIGASVNGIAALSALVRRLPRSLPAAILVVQHTTPEGPGRLHEVLGTAGPLPAAPARDGEPIVPSRIYVAPPDRHLLVRAGHTLQLSRGPKENCTRPAVDPTFRSAALAYGPAAVGIVLTGYLDDGTAGLLAIKDRGGVAIVQDPAEAMVPSMPRSALRHVAVDHVATLEEIASLIVMLANDDPGAEPTGPPPATVELEDRLAHGRFDPADWRVLDARCRPAGLTCPDCRSALVELDDARLLRFRCRAGHAFGALSLLSAMARTRDDLLASAIGALMEESALAARFACDGADGDAALAGALQRRALRLDLQAATLADWLAKGEADAADASGPPLAPAQSAGDRAS